MDAPNHAPATAAMARLSAVTGDDYRVVGRLAGGETGAHEVRGPAGERLVVKWEDDPGTQTERRRGVELTRRLGTEAGWPVPEQRIIEDADRIYVLQALLPGTSIAHLTHALVDDLLALHEPRLGLAADDPDATWPDHLVETLVSGGSNYCLHEPLRAYDTRAAAFVDRVEAIGRELDPAEFAAADIVHWDFHTGNLLEHDGRLGAVVDNDFVTVGDGAFDLVTLAVAALTMPCDAGVRDRVVNAGLADLGDARRAAYVAHLVLRCADWDARKGRFDDIDQWLVVGDRLMPA
jgi:hypothetical protein